MEATLTRPAATCCCRALLSSSATTRLALGPSLLSGARRQKSTKARTKAVLNIPAHPSFFAERSTEDHIVFNPPSSAPSVLHTPFKFLPKSDPRRRAMFDATLFASSVTTQYASTSPDSSASRAPSVEDLPKVLERDDPVAKNHSMTKEQVEEMRRLRLEDPVTNSVQALARRFGCSVMFVMMCVNAPAEHREKVHLLPQQAARERWGPKKRDAREQRKRRVEMLMKGEI